MARSYKKRGHGALLQEAGPWRDIDVQERDEP
jgi:hypothetical protein